MFNIKKTTTAPSEPGIYSGLSNADYHAGPGISKSGLDLIARSPLHYWDAYINPSRPQRVETPAMAFGTAVHTAILEPHDFARWIVMDKVDGRTTAGKAAKAEAEARAAAEGVPMIDSATLATIKRIATQVEDHPMIGHILDTGVPELSVYWVDEDTGVFCRCRPDWLGANCVLDLKTTEDASPQAFMNSAYTYRYWVQASFYMDGLAANGLNMFEFIFAAIEKSSPHAVMAYPAGDALIAAGRREYKRLLRTYADCLAGGDWPGYAGVWELALPRWAPESLDFNNAVASDVDFG